MGNSFRTSARGRLAKTASSALILAMLASCPVYAQGTAAGASDDGVDDSEIFVTARQRNETLQDVPVAVTSISSKTLETFEVTNVDKLDSRVPSLVIQQGGANGGASLSLRGVGTANLSPAFQSAVALDFDGVQLGQLRILQAGFFDMEQVDVLKGPQSLYFGKSASAGVLTLRSAGPTSSFSIKAKGGYEFEERGYFTEVAVSGPITDTLGFRIAGRSSKIDRLVKNEAQFVANPFRGSRDIYARGILKWEPTSEFTSDLRVSYINSQRDGSNLFADINCGKDGVADRAATLGGGGPSFVAGYSCKVGDGVYHYPDLAPELVRNLPGGLPQSVVPNHQTEIWLGRWRNDVSLTDNFSLTAITGYYELDTVESDSFSYGGLRTAAVPPGSPPGPLISYGTSLGLANFRTAQFSQEFRANLKELGPVDLTVGAFYERREDDADTALYPLNFAILRAPIPGPTSDLYKTQNTKADAYSAFASGIVKLSDQLELAGGVRYTKETKTSSIRVPQVYPLITPPNPFSVPVGFFSGPIKFSGSNWSPEASLTFKVTPDVNVYAAYKTGFKSGGIDSAVLPSAPFVVSARQGNFDTIRFKSETSKGFELGLKSQLLDRQLTFNAALYRYQFNDLQLIQFNPAVINFVTLNASQVTTKGVDIDVAWKAPVEGLTLTTAINYLDAKFTKDFCPTVRNTATGLNDSRNCALGTADRNLRGRASRVAPKWTGNFGGVFAIPMGSVKLTLNGNARFSSSYFVGDANVADPRQSSYMTYDAGAAFGAEDDSWTLSLSAVNLTDKLYFTSITPRPAATATGDDEIWSYNRGRQVFLTGTVKF
jgi:iron complex outermembrane recepter protein